MNLDIPLGSIVVGLDSSEGAASAVDWGAALARRERRPLALLHAHDSPSRQYGDIAWLSVEAARWQQEMERLGKVTVEDAARRVLAAAPELDVHRVSSTYDPRTTLVAAAERAAVLVVGTRGRGRIARLVLGSVSDYTARHATCPVVVVREPGAAGPVVVGIDSGPAATATLDFAYAQASLWESPLTVVHCDWRQTVALAGEDDAVAARLVVAEAIAGFGEKYPDVPVSVEVLASDDPAGALASAAHGARLLVLGRHPHGGLRDLVAPHVVVGALERARCSVAVVPTGAGRW